MSGGRGKESGGFSTPGRKTIYSLSDESASNAYIPTQGTAKIFVVGRPMSVTDMLYGPIELPPIIRLFVDTPPVQRLRDLKQLGNTHYTYPGASNTRFEHSLGVSHLAMEFFRCILTSHRQDNRDFGVSELTEMSQETEQRDMWCIGIAGLCHDLGHGPLSHMFEDFVNAVNRERGAAKWSHEMMSVVLLRGIWHDKKEELEQMGLNDTEDLRFVELLINGLRPCDPWPTNVGRPAWKRFMTEIVANKRNGLDVDKLDYIQRDSLACLGVSVLSPVRRLFQGARVVINEMEQTAIGFQDKLDGCIEEVFTTRSLLHRIIYQHRATKIMDQMTKDALMAARGHFIVSHRDKAMKLEDCTSSPNVYVQLSDWIIGAILHSTDPQLERSREILRSIHNRKLYTTIGYYRMRSYDRMTYGSAIVHHLDHLERHQKSMEEHLRTSLQNKPSSPSQRSRFITDKMQSTLSAIEVQTENLRSLLTQLEVHGKPSGFGEQMIELTVERMMEVVQRCNVSLYERLRKWERENDGLFALECLIAEVTQTAGDMDKAQSPLDQTYFFSARQGSNLSRVTPHSYRNVTTSMCNSIAPVTSVTMICRVPLSDMEREQLRNYFAEMTEQSKHSTTLDFSVTPERERGSYYMRRERSMDNESSFVNDLHDEKPPLQLHRAEGMRENELLIKMLEKPKLQSSSAQPVSSAVSLSPVALIPYPTNCSDSENDEVPLC